MRGAIGSSNRILKFRQSEIFHRKEEKKISEHDLINRFWATKNIT